jgi:hypothetical protein
MNQHRNTVHSVAAVLVVLVSAGVFSASPAYAQFPGTPLTLGEQNSTGSTPAVSALPSAENWAVITGYKSTCSLSPSVSTAPAILATVVYPGGNVATWPIPAKVPGGSIVYDAGVPGPVPPGGSVTFTPFSTFPTGATCTTTVTWATGSEAQVWARTVLGRVQNNQGMTFWIKEANGSTPSLASTTSPGAAGTASLIHRVVGTCTDSTAFSSQMLLELTVTSGDSSWSVPVTGDHYTPNVLSWDSGEVAYPLVPGATFSLGPVGTFPASATCVVGVAAVAGTEIQIGQIALSVLGLRGITGLRSAPSLAAQAGSGPATPHTFTVSASQPGAVPGLLAFCTVPSPGYGNSTAPVGTVSITSGGKILVYPVTPTTYGSNTLYYAHSGFSASVDPGTSVTFTALSSFLAGTTCTDTVETAAGASGVIDTVVLDNY